MREEKCNCKLGTHRLDLGFGGVAAGKGLIACAVIGPIDIGNCPTINRFESVGKPDELGAAIGNSEV